ncbi:uncharacterized protein LOC122857401 isoform X2 [Aphidius gifuensis]|nr:uncharacterized protein LOC122857401 isoform X2 [Aphidius gifuensis]
MSLKLQILQILVPIIFVSLISANLIFDNVQESIDLQVRFHATIDTINFCFFDEPKYGIVLVGDSKDIDIQLLMDYGPVIELDKSVVDESDNNYKLQIFIVTIDLDLEANIKRLKKSSWWNHDGFYIIIDNGLSKSQKCKDAGDVLQIAWKMDILRVIFICTDGTNGQVMFYTFNPFTSRSLISWERVKHINNESTDPWTLYRQRYIPNSLKCTTIDHDKTLHLDGYGGVSAAFSGVYNDRNHEKLIRFLYEQLNVTLSYLTMNDSLGLEVEGTSTTLLGNLLANKSLDMRLRFKGMVYTKEIVFSSIAFQSSYTLISKNHGKKSMFDQIYELFGWRLILIMAFFSITTIIMFKISMSMDIDLAILEIIRMWGNASFLKKPTDLPSRIYLFGILLLALILCSVFQGKILGFQLNPNPEKNIDTVNDLLVEFKNYKIYGSKIVINFLDEELIKRSISVKSIKSCVKYVVNDSSSVCAGGWLKLQNEALKYSDLYVAKAPFVKLYGALPMRKNWPLANRVNTILTQYFEHQPFKFSFLYLRKDHDGFSDDPKPLKRQHFDFAFKFLILGLGIAFVIFIIELFQYKNTRLFI